VKGHSRDPALNQYPLPDNRFIKVSKIFRDASKVQIVAVHNLREEFRVSGQGPDVDLASSTVHHQVSKDQADGWVLRHLGRSGGA